MPTDNERREVARRLRELSRCVFSPENTYELLADAFGVDDFEDTSDLFNRLADHIEPDTNFYYPPDSANSGPKDTAEVVLDRKEMLMIADELVDRARRIREALGVRDGD